MSDAPKAAEPLPPTALPADVYLDKLERLLHENARLRAYLGQALGILRCVDATAGSIDPDWTEAAVLPAVAWLEAVLK